MSSYMIMNKPKRINKINIEKTCFENYNNNNKYNSYSDQSYNSYNTNLKNKSEFIQELEIELIDSVDICNNLLMNSKNYIDYIDKIDNIEYIDTDKSDLSEASSELICNLNDNSCNSKDKPRDTNKKQSCLLNCEAITICSNSEDNNNQENLNLHYNKKKIKEKLKNDYYNNNYQKFMDNKQKYINLIEKLLEGNNFQLNLNDVNPDLNYIKNRYKFNLDFEYQLNKKSIDKEFNNVEILDKGKDKDNIQKSSKIKIYSNKLKNYCYLNDIQCEAYTNQGIQCSRKVNEYNNQKQIKLIQIYNQKTNYYFCGIHLHKQANGNIYTGYYKK